MLSISTKLVQEKSLRVFKEIQVCTITCLEVRLVADWLLVLFTSDRSSSTWNIRKSPHVFSICQLFHRWIHPRLFTKLAPCIGDVFSSSLPHDHRRCYGKIHGPLHTVCSIIQFHIYRFFMSTFRLSSDATGNAGTISEESISTIRTAKAFNTQSHIGVLFKDQVLLASRADMKLALVQGFGIAAMFFISYASYGLGRSLFWCSTFNRV